MTDPFQPTTPIDKIEQLPQINIPQLPSTVIEKNKRLSDSKLWHLQRNFFSQKGANAWSEGIVPHYVTSNPYIADAYAQVMLGWLRDIKDSVDTSQFVYIVELGAGSGRFAYHFLTIFFDMLENSVLRDIKVTYVMTDFTKSTLAFWKRHRQLQTWVDEGKLDFAKFDAESDTALMLINQRIRLSPGVLKNPLGLIANYFFDGLTHDVFLINEGKVYESLVTLTVAQENPDLDDPNLLNYLDLSYDDRELEQGSYYKDDDFNTLLLAYQSKLSHTNLLFPIGSLECLRRLLALSQGRMFLLTCDKGYHLEIEFEYREKPALAMHGSFSMMVNYHALGEYFKLLDGQFIGTPHHHSSLDICAMFIGQDDYPETRLAFYQQMIRRNPDDFYNFTRAIDVTLDYLSVNQFLSLVRQSGWDSTVFMTYYARLLENIESITFGQRQDLHDAMHQIWKTYYFIGEEYDVPFAIGGLFYALDFYADAIEFLEYSSALYGEHAPTLGNLAMCHVGLGQFEIALDCVNRCLKVDPNFEPAHEMKARIEEELQPKAD